MGELFENLFRNACARQGAVVTRIPDGCRTLGRGRVQRVRTPFDWILTLDGRTAFIDTKTCDSDTFRNSSIDEHQVKHLLAHERAGAIGGYAVWLRSSDSLIFIPASLLLRALGVRGSIAADHPEVRSLGNSQNFNAARIFSQPREEGTSAHEQTPDQAPGPAPRDWNDPTEL